MLPRRKIVAIIMQITLLFFSAVPKTQADLQITREEAITILIEKVIKPDEKNGKVMAFCLQSPLKKGDIVEPAFYPKTIAEKPIRKIQTPTWFFWIDDYPYTDFFAHPARFVYIDANTTNPILGHGIIVERFGWWPKINGQHLYRSTSERAGSHDLVYGSRPSFFDRLKFFLR